ncbi:putative glucosylceramidase 3 [Armadillidium nasatum]|uniref:Glucosylceramidase n=1 Tax=Armadillidium nasatum TaxID=96803 RepID=A0A5N5SMH4_9CRUS|nr:putative glucosylceramidase 3 [Armadillidium nasatum]
MILFSVFFLLCSLFVQGCYEDPTSCDERVYDRDSFVCVCDAEYCDVTGDFSIPFEGKFKRIISSRDAYRFHVIEEELKDFTNGDLKIEVNYEGEYQTILGFGGAFSDSTGINIYSLPKEAQSKLLRSYFSEEGIEYNMGRIPIGGTDFSTRPYSNDDDHEDDVELKHFALTEEDHIYKIPYIKEALSVSKDEVLLFSSIWSPPPWMKENKKHNGKGRLLRSMWDPYTNYMIRFVEEYQKHNLSLWGITTANEPSSGLENWPWNACGFTAEDMRDWIKTSLGPGLEKANMNHLKIFDDKDANKYVDGIGVHWYLDPSSDPQILNDFHESFPDKFILYTEACEGVFNDPEDKVQLGSWERAETYSSNIIEKEKEFYKQPMFYAMGHFSKFIKRGSKRLASTISGKNSENLQVAAFRLTDPNSYAFVVLNKGDKEEDVSINTRGNKFINVQLNPKSLETIVIRMF